MKTKKLIAGLISAVTFASVSVSAIVSAAGDLSVKVSDAEAAPGDKFTITVDLADIPSTGLSGCEFAVSYDSSLVTMTGVKLGSLAKDVSGVEVADGETLLKPLEQKIEADAINIMYALGTTNTDYYMMGEGTLLELEGTVNTTAAPGSKAEFKIVPIDRATKPGSAETNGTVVFGYLSNDGSDHVYTADITNGTLTVTGGVDPTDDTTPTGSEDTKPTEPIGDPTVEFGTVTMWGDANCDEEVTVSDVVALNKWLLNSVAYPLKPNGASNADVVNDGKLRTEDSSLLMNYLGNMISADKLGQK